VTHLLNTGALMESSCGNLIFDFILILISCADWRLEMLTNHPSKTINKNRGNNFYIMDLCMLFVMEVYFTDRVSSKL